MDCTQAIQLSDSFDKAYFRRGLCRKASHRYKSALVDFERAMQLCGDNKEVKSNYDEVHSLLQEKKKIKISPVKLNSSLKSSKPMVILQTTNLNEDIDMEETNENLTSLREQIKQIVFNQIPTNFADFEKSWRELSTCSAQEKLEFLQNIDFNLRSEIFRYLSFEIMADLVVLLAECQSITFIVGILHQMVQAPSFDLNICFLASSPKETQGNAVIISHFV